MVDDDPDNKLELKAFHNEIIHNHIALKKEIEAYVFIPIIKQVSSNLL